VKHAGVAETPWRLHPLLISAGFLAAFLIMFFQGELVPQPDEGTAAHLFQILMPTQFLIIALFASSGCPKGRRLR